MSQIKVSVCGGGCRDIAVPNTGFITNINTNNHYNGGEIMGVGLFVILIALFGILASIVLKKRNKHHVMVHNSGFNLSSHRKNSIRVFALAFVIVAVSFVTFDQIRKQEKESYAVPQQDEQTLTIKTDDIDLNVKIDNGEESAFGYAASKVEVRESTLFGYSLMAYVADNSLRSEHGDEIKSIDSETPTVLANNTWGIATEKPSDENSSVWYGLPTALDEAIVLKNTDYATPENDATTVYYGVKINNELACGDYEATTINYVAVANVIPPDVMFEYQGEETYFDNGRVTTNRAGFADTCVKSKGYIGSDYEVLKTDNMDENGNWDGDSVELGSNGVTIPGVDRLVLEVKYELHEGVDMEIYGKEGGLRAPVASYTDEGDGVARYVVDGDSVVVYAYRDRSSTGGSGEGDDGDGDTRLSDDYGRYGYYIKVYPVYNSEQAGTSYEELPEKCGWEKVLGGYKNPMDRDGMELNGWVSDYIDAIGENLDFRSGSMFDEIKAGRVDADAAIKYLLTRGGLGEALKGQTVVFYADWEPYYEIKYEGNGGKALVCKTGAYTLDPYYNSALLMGGKKVGSGSSIRCPESEQEERTTLTQRIMLNDPNSHYLEEYYESVIWNMYKDDYTLVGWSTNPNATEPEYDRYEIFALPDNPDERGITLYAIWSSQPSPKNGGGDRDSSESIGDSIK